eukprot:2948485-Amphidinium_carterae.2
MAATRPSKEREPYLSVQVNYMEELTYMPLHYDARNDTDCSSWVNPVGRKWLRSFGRSPFVHHQ